MEQPYRVRDDAQMPLAHHGEEFTSGAIVQLEPHVAFEVRHLVDPVGADGQVRPWGAPADEAIDAELAAARPHERVSILEAAIAGKRGDLDRLEKLHAAEVKKNEAASKADKPKGMTQSRPGASEPGGAALQK